MKLWWHLGFVVLLAGCLQTRETMEDGGDGRATLREQMKALQAKSAQQELRIDEILAEVRALNGKMSSFTPSTGASQETSSQEVEQLKARLKVYEEALEKLDQEIRLLKKSGTSSASSLPAGDLAKGDFFFEQKNWSEAIRAYESYRQKNPKGKNYPKATLRIALAFQSMGMNNEAKAFFQEVASQYPKSDEARVASSRLSNM
jgi:TolA-binding protein